MAVWITKAVTCKSKHYFIVFQDHPKDSSGEPACPHCMSVKLAECNKAFESVKELIVESNSLLASFVTPK